MKQINLLPYNLQKRAANKRIVMAGVFAALCALAATGVFYGSVKVINDSFSDVTVSGTKPVVSATPKSEVDTSKRVKAINTLTSAEIDWTKSFNLVHGLMATNLATSAYTVTVDTAGTTIKTVGTASSNLAFATYYQTLQKDKRVLNVAMDTYTYAPDKGTVTFALTITVDPSLMRYAKQ